ncbi:MAG: fused MFS/spermidine synthase [Proteobacteria bacterium]|nr:fused MFS/spermidine synthase [Burkholderiales bacterium]
MSISEAPKTSAARAAVMISEARGLRLMHLGDDAIQSRMHLDRPDELSLAYTRAMMGALLFHPRARDFLMIGLGGGSLAKFIHRRLPRACVTAIEINAQVLIAARTMFGVPKDGGRFRAVLADGAKFVRTLPDAQFDVVLLDAYCGGRQVTAITRRVFYAHVRRVLRPDGVLVVNCIADQPELRGYLDNLCRAFDDRVWAVPTPPDDNLVVFALGPAVAEPTLEALRPRAVRWQARLALPFQRWVRGLRAVPHSTDRQHPRAARGLAARPAPSRR